MKRIARLIRYPDLPPFPQLTAASALVLVLSLATLLLIMKWQGPTMQPSETISMTKAFLIGGVSRRDFAEGITEIGGVPRRDFAKVIAETSGYAAYIGRGTWSVVLISVVLIKGYWVTRWRFNQRTFRLRPDPNDTVAKELFRIMQGTPMPTSTRPPVPTPTLLPSEQLERARQELERIRAMRTPVPADAR